MRPAIRRLSGPTLLFALVLTGPARAQPLPTPESVLGHRIGDDFYLATWEESLDYLRQLAAASDRVHLVEVGRTSFGRPWYVAVISSPDNLADLDRYRSIARRLAHPEGLTDAEAHRLAREGKAIVHIDGGLHASEVAHAQHTVQLAYDLASETEDPEILAILDNVILLLWPSINPDGQTIVAEWYRSNLGTPYEVAPLPRLYQKYIGHDNNRDGYMLNMIESRVVTRVLRDWEPQLLYNHHQTAPFPARIWIPPFAEPISEFVHPLMWRTVNLMGMAMAEALEERGQRGAVHMGSGFDNWYPGFMDHANNFHNVAAFLTETGLYRYATPHFYTVNDFPRSRRDLRPRSLYASPWEGGWWRLRDAVDYMLTASISVLDFAAKYREDVLYNRYQAGRDVIAGYRSNPPFGYFIPEAQRDPVAAVELLRRLAFNGIEVRRLSREAVVAGETMPAGTWVIPMDQPFANFVRQLFAVQHYPDLREFPEGPPEQPYDVAGWTLPWQMDVRVVAADAPLDADLRAAFTPVRGTPVPWSADGDASPFDMVPGPGFDTDSVAAGIRPPPGRVRGRGNRLRLDPAQNNAFRALNRAWALGARVAYRAGTPRDGDTPPVAGSYLVSGLDRAAGDRMVSDYALQVERTGEDGVAMPRPRIGLYRPWQPSIDAGWTRWLLEMYGFDARDVTNGDVRAGRLHDRFDVLIVADISPRQIREGFQKGRVPPRYAGGLGAVGARALDAFVRDGGTLVAVNGSAQYAIDELHLPVKNVVGKLQRKKFFMSGGLLEMIVDPSHPVMAGMPERARIFVDHSPVFDVEDNFEGSVFAHYETTGSPLLSGYLLGEDYLKGYAAGVDVRHGTGHVVLLGMRPQWRGQPFGNFRILLNAALYEGSVAAAHVNNDSFWSSPPSSDTTDSNGDGGRR